MLGGMENQHLCAECGRLGATQTTRCRGICNESVPMCRDCLEELEGRYVCELCQEELAQDRHDESG